jgi:hypothetical protein
MLSSVVEFRKKRWVTDFSLNIPWCRRADYESAACRLEWGAALLKIYGENVVGSNLEPVPCPKGQARDQNNLLANARSTHLTVLAPLV